MSEILYTVPEVSEILKVNQNCVYGLLKSGLLPCLKLGRFKVRKTALEHFLETYEGKDISNPYEVKELVFEEL